MRVWTTGNGPVVWLCEHYNAGVHNFFQKCRRRIKILAVRRVNMKQVLCWRPTNIRRFRTKFSRLFDLAPRCYIQGEEFLYDLDEWGYEGGFCCKELLAVVTGTHAECINPIPHTLHFAIDPVSCRATPPPPPPPRGRVREPYPPLLQTASHLINANCRFSFICSDRLMKCSQLCYC
jgi:hypothetical protein